MLVEFDRPGERSSEYPGEGGVLPYMAYTGMYHWTGYGFCPLCACLCSKQGILFRASLS